MQPEFAPGKQGPIAPGQAIGLHLRLVPSRLMAILTGVFAVLLLLHLVVVSSYLDGWRFPGRDRFYFDHENNVPTFFSTFILLLACGVLGLVASAKRRLRDPFSRQWLAMSLLFLLLAIDEAASLHELLIQPLRTAFGLTGWLWFGWVMVGALFVAAFALAHLRFLAGLPRRFRWLFVACGAAYVVGALGFEMLGGKVFLAGQATGELGPYMLVMTLEESLEIAAILLFNRTLLQYLQGYCTQLRVDVVPESRPVPLRTGPTLRSRPQIRRDDGTATP